MNIELIRELTEAWGPPSQEGRVREIVKTHIAGLVDEMRVDRMGNLIALKRATIKPAGSEAPKRVMLSAHMDEIGFIITHVDEKGFSRFNSVGGLRPLTLVGNRVVFADGAVGTIQIEKGPRAATEAPGFEQLFIDVGAADRKSSPIKVGDLGALQGVLAQSGDRLIGKSMDDRIACVVAIEAMRQLKQTPHDIHAVFSVQEEVGLRGARTAAYGVNPDIGIAVDVTLTGDFPEAPFMEVALGKGTAIKVQDSSVIADPRLRNLMVQRAREGRIPYQLEVLTAGGTDTAAIQMSREGVPAGCISIPCRYVHSISEMVDIKDIQASINLLTAILSKPIDLD
ncbi:MAG: M20/M25/M40 family metallo-hydrolase [Chloroflexi bacterium]|nr:M20/M25/M40 family metallo-hydrolase [Chloroflexota bacterium]MCL5274714.1 M20/M25/M40 family metallo-hydrolase [Chloroflexota bacterium]